MIQNNLNTALKATIRTMDDAAVMKTLRQSMQTNRNEAAQ